MLRKTVFWIHLSVGAAAALVIAMMSATGVLLTYERQLLQRAENAMHVALPTGEPRPLPIIELAAATRAHDPSFEPTAVTIVRDPRAPVSVTAGRSGAYFVNPYTGEILADSAAGIRAFFRAITAWHRWFAVEGDGRETARAITGASNLVFLFLILSGMYLWLPPIWRWAGFRTRLLFNPKAASAKARDFNWHHVFGIWTAIPLAVIVASALVFSYGWANDLVYRAVGEQPPTRSAPGDRPAASDPTAAVRGQPRLPLDELASRAAKMEPGWRRLTIPLPGGSETEVRVTVDSGNGGQPQHRREIALDAGSGEILAETPFSDLTAGRRARLMIRFLHTGEALGVAGQTVAGLVSLLSLLMVWTGLALAWRRLVTPLVRRIR